MPDRPRCLAGLLSHPSTRRRRRRRAHRQRRAARRANRSCGALVTLTRADGLFVETVYAGTDGRYRLEPLQQGTAIAARASSGLCGRLDRCRSGRRVASTTSRSTPLTDVRAISEQLTRERAFRATAVRTPADRQWFQVECLTCHQVGNAYTRMPRHARSAGTQILTRMLGFYNVTDAAWIERYVTRARDDVRRHAVDDAADARRRPEALPARLIEWKLPGGVIAHDVELIPADGKFYTVDQGTDQIYITDPKTTRHRDLPDPRRRHADGGKFFKLTGNPNPVGLSGAARSAQPAGRTRRSLLHDRHGQRPDRRVRSRDADVRRSRHRRQGALSAHAAVRSQGRVWFTISFSNQVGMLDTRNDRMRARRPAARHRSRRRCRRAMPYGIDVNPVDGSVWYSSLMANRIGRIDARHARGQVVRAARRWARAACVSRPTARSGSRASAMASSSSSTRRRCSTSVPDSGAGTRRGRGAICARHAPEDAGDVWITVEHVRSDVPLPAAREALRLVPDADAGHLPARHRVHAAGLGLLGVSPVPAALTVEGGMQEIVCLDPVGNLPLPRAARLRILDSGWGVSCMTRIQQTQQLDHVARARERAPPDPRRAPSSKRSSSRPASARSRCRKRRSRSPRSRSSSSSSLGSTT